MRRHKTERWCWWTTISVIFGILVGNMMSVGTVHRVFSQDQSTTPYSVPQRIAMSEKASVVRLLRIPKVRAATRRTITQDDQKRIAVTGLSRSGSTWQYNIVRELLRLTTTDKSTIISSAHSDGDNTTLFDACLSRPPCVIKTHLFSPRLLNQVDIILTSHRDIRDVLLSSMQMFRSCLGTSAALRSSLLQPTARDHDVAQRFQHYAHWLPFARYDMRYETMWQNPAAEVQRLAGALGIDKNRLSLKQAQQIVDTVESMKKEHTKKHKWDLDSGFSSQHVHEATTRPGAHANPDILVDVSLKLPSCPLAQAMDHIQLGWGTWLKEQGYSINDTTQNLFVTSLPDTSANVWPHIVHLVVADSDDNKDVHESLYAAARLAKRDYLVDIQIVTVLLRDNDTFRDSAICIVPKLTADHIFECGRDLGADFILLSTIRIQTASILAYERVRRLLADERLPLSRGFSLPTSAAADTNNATTALFSQPHELLLMPAEWRPNKIPITARGWGAAVLTHVSETEGQVLVLFDAEPFFYTIKIHELRDSRGVLVKALSGPAVLRRCCCPMPSESERPPRLDHNTHAVTWLNGIPREMVPARDLALTRCGALLHAADDSLAVETRRVLNDWCRTVKEEDNNFSPTLCRIPYSLPENRRRPPLAEDAKTSSALRVLLVREVWPTQSEGADARCLRLVEWLSQDLGFSVHLALPSGTQRGIPPWNWIRDIYALERCPSFSEFDVVLLEFSPDGHRRQRKPAALEALDRIERDWRRKQQKPPRNVVLISWELHYHLTAALGSETKHAALVYAYERAAYTSPFIGAILTQSQETRRAFNELQSLAGDAKKKPIVFALTVRAAVNAPDTVRAHLSTLKSRRDTVVFFGGSSAATRSALNWLLSHGWPALQQSQPQLKLILTGSIEFEQVAHESLDHGILYEPDASLAVSRSRVLILPPTANRLLVSSASTQALFALEHGLPMVAPANSSLGGLFDPATGKPVLDHRQRVSPVSFFQSDNLSGFVAQVKILLIDDLIWEASAIAALDLALRLSSSPTWATDSPLALFLRGSGSSQGEGEHSRPSKSASSFVNHTLDLASPFRGSGLEDSLVTALALRPMLRATLSSAAAVVVQ